MGFRGTGFGGAALAHIGSCLIVALLH
jgi:hypothetical protein